MKSHDVNSEHINRDKKPIHTKYIVEAFVWCLIACKFHNNATLYLLHTATAVAGKRNEVCSSEGPWCMRMSASLSVCDG